MNPLSPPLDDFHVFCVLAWDIRLVNLKGQSMISHVERLTLLQSSHIFYTVINALFGLRLVGHIVSGFIILRRLKFSDPAVCPLIEAELFHPLEKFLGMRSNLLASP